MVVAGEAEGPCIQIRLLDGVEYDLGVEALGMGAHALHERRSLQAADVARPVVHIGGGGHLPTDFEAGNQHRLQVGAGRVHGSGVAGRTGPENQQSAVFDISHE